jgi:NAD(P)H-dependent FMN reductase
MAQLGVIVCSVREGRVGLPVAEWFLEVCAGEPAFTPTLIDLNTVNLPMLSEPAHPRLKQYTQPSTIEWSATIDRMDAFVFVTPEYNHGTPPALVNALDHLYQEWNYKPAGFVSYGGVSAGLRSVQMTKPILLALRMMPVVEAVAIPSVNIHQDKETGRFTGTDAMVRAGQTMLKELARCEMALRTLR